MQNIDEIITRYERGEDTTRICRDFNVSAETIRRWLDSAGIKRRTIADRNRRYQYRHDAFSLFNPITAYWAGLLMADGSVSKNGLILLELNIKDRELVQSLANFIEYTGPLAPRTRYQKSGTISKMISLRVTAPDLAEQLTKWGVVQRKTYQQWNISLRNVLEGHYFRGLFDGDGCFHVRKNGKLYASISGNPMLIDGFRDWCWRTFREPGSLVRKKKFHKVQFSGQSALKLGNALYVLSGPRLQRKEELFKSCL